MNNREISKVDTLREFLHEYNREQKFLPIILTKSKAGTKIESNSEQP